MNNNFPQTPKKENCLDTKEQVLIPAEEIFRKETEINSNSIKIEKAGSGGSFFEYGK